MSNDCGPMCVAWSAKRCRGAFGRWRSCIPEVPDGLRTMTQPQAVTVTVVNHLEERLLDQAQAWAPYKPPFGGGHSRSTPQRVVSDVESLVKSSFWETE